MFERRNRTVELMHGNDGVIAAPFQGRQFGFNGRAVHYDAAEYRPM